MGLSGPTSRTDPSHPSILSIMMECLCRLKYSQDKLCKGWTPTLLIWAEVLRNRQQISSLRSRATDSAHPLNKLHNLTSNKIEINNYLPITIKIDSNRGLPSNSLTRRLVRYRGTLAVSRPHRPLLHISRAIMDRGSRTVCLRANAPPRSRDPCIIEDHINNSMRMHLARMCKIGL